MKNKLKDLEFYKSGIELAKQKNEREKKEVIEEVIRDWQDIKYANKLPRCLN